MVAEMSHLRTETLQSVFVHSFVAVRAGHLRTERWLAPQPEFMVSSKAVRAEGHLGEENPGPPSYDDSAWPIFVMKPPLSSLSPAHFRAHLDNVERAFARGKPFGLLVDARGSRPFNAVQRRMIAARVRDNNVRHGGLLKGMAVVLNSSVRRGVFTAVNWLARPPYPIAAFEGLSEAKVWLNSLIERDRIGKG